MKKITKQAQHKLDEIEESKKISFDTLFSKEGYVKLSIQKLNEEQKEYLASIGRRRAQLNAELAKVKRLVKYKRERVK